MDGDDQVADAGKGASPYGFIGELRKPALDQIQPRRPGGDEVELESRVLGQPGLDLGMGMSPVVVEDQMQFQVFAELAVEAGQELEELLVAVTEMNLAYHRALEQIQGGEESSRTMPLVVVSHGPAAPLLHG